MLRNSSNVTIKGNAKVTNAAADSYICDQVIHNNSPGLGPSPRYTSIPMIFKFPRWTPTHKLERTEIRLELMIATLDEYKSKSTTLPKRWDWLTEKIEEYNEETERLLVLAKEKSFFDLPFKAKVDKHVAAVKELRNSVQQTTRTGLIDRLKRKPEDDNVEPVPCQKCSEAIPQPGNSSEPITTSSEPITTSSEPITTPSEPITTPSEPITTPSEPITMPSEPITMSTAPLQPAITR
ncbi:hypothetical protein K443DRAFT_175307 [Laccaria amethystina LaAM-08-1]|uniref:Uncharacterized protein n=1 Tax=Laccaria amethystina LaAM-08-1 TaxID=1095629 RepID=A0A0C9XTP0_9AGAR|nr:hypothetical protein K443DRAFT_175307 [Laccaria amethystina LaAM-08-1]